MPRSARSTTSSSPTRAIAATAAYIERVGFYNPIAAAGEECVRIAHARLAYWSQRGARLSDTVAMLVKRAPAAGAVAVPGPAAEAQA